MSDTDPSAIDHKEDAARTTETQRIAAAIVAFRREPGLATTVEALFAQDRRLDEVIVVDNGGDGAAARVAARFPRLVVVDAGDNLGAAGGFALAFEKAAELKIDWLYLLNDDDCPRPHAISTLLARLEADIDRPSLVGIGGWVSVAGVPRAVGSHFRRGLRYPNAAERADVEYQVDTTTFGGLLLSVAKVGDIGGIRRDFFMMWEEYELCLRLRREGGRIVIVTEPLVDLSGHEGSQAYPPWRGYYESRNGLITIRELGLRSALPWFLLRQLKFLLAGYRLPTPFRRAHLRLLGLWHGFRGVRGRTVEPG